MLITCITHCYMYTGLCILAVRKRSEDYEHLAIEFKQKFIEINELIANPVLKIEGIQYTLEFLYLQITR